ncbi:hypothetical protein ASPWEDRAFT_269744 [Aspergillus wentii DTO 134E9]|uniref:GHMP kinase C-terminal domain-containing protein n=1 Tax=Aspergillus wentii DTO 134E9 TaxID=1073089 RepID=A0A1L9S2U6_ASPWE|nr:uncharacterized protein ASPWEDRAFT_269744 [Aspergillus wentii DTO 134E9]OJJ41495.1 hypothetical protein ASPWEDRAFT_269744 [Aspergillus wentii DTO 134E9]
MALQAGRTAGSLASLMTGSGSTCVFLANDEQHAANRSSTRSADKKRYETWYSIKQSNLRYQVV